MLHEKIILKVDASTAIDWEKLEVIFDVYLLLFQAGSQRRNSDPTGSTWIAAKPGVFENYGRGKVAGRNFWNVIVGQISVILWDCHFVNPGKTDFCDNQGVK